MNAIYCIEYDIRAQYIVTEKKGLMNMKRQVRTNVFETNSSSQHSLCIMKKDEHYTSEEILEDFFMGR